RVDAPVPVAVGGTVGGLATLAGAEAGGEADPQAVAGDGAEVAGRAAVGEGSGHRLIGEPELGPGVVGPEGVVADVEGDGAGAVGEVEGLLGIEGESGDVVVVVGALAQLAVADDHVGAGAGGTVAVAGGDGGRGPG